MLSHVKRVVMYTTDQLSDAERQALEGLHARDLLKVKEDNTIWVFPGAPAEEDLTADERRLVYKLLGHELLHEDLPWITKRAGLVGGRAAIAGTRTPVWQVINLLRISQSRSEVRMQTGLSDEQISEAIAYELRHREEIERDVFENVIAPTMVGAGQE